MSAKLHPKLTVQFYTQGKCFGPGVAQLLQQVQTHRSLRAAAMSMAMAYSKAWSIIKTAERELGFALLYSTTGGKQGGGAVLTEQAERLLKDYAAYTEELRELGETKFNERFSWLTE